MPKMKTSRGAAKRVKKTAGGVKRKKAFRSHILTKKTTKRKRGLRQATTFSKPDAKRLTGIIGA